MIRILLACCLLFVCGCAAKAPSGQGPTRQAPSEQAIGRVTGHINCSALSSCQGNAVLWPAEGAAPDPRKYTRIPIAVAPVLEDGTFELSAPVGEYYVGAFLRNSAGPQMGPPRNGDLIFLSPNPAGAMQLVRVRAGQVVDVGSHQNSWEYAGLTDPAATAIRGQVVDIDGQPVAGLLVFAFADRDVSTTPLTVSERTADDGSFFLPLAEAGTVYLRTRKDYRGGRPEPGDFIGVFGGALPMPLRVEEGVTIEGMKIVAREVPSLMQMKNAPNTSRPNIQPR